MGGLAYAVVLTAARMITTKGGFILIRFLWLFCCYSWQIVLNYTATSNHGTFNRAIFISVAKSTGRLFSDTPLHTGCR